MNPRHVLQEVMELGPRVAAFRLGWELKVWSGWAVGREKLHRYLLGAPVFPFEFSGRYCFPSPVEVREAMKERIPSDGLERLHATARDATGGRILCFGRWTADFGNPIDWRLDPLLKKRWDLRPWTQAMRQRHGGDIKTPWEVGRFPQAYWMARAATFFPEARAELAAALEAQMLHFIEQNPMSQGIHWASGQEIAIRALAWIFAECTLFRDDGSGATGRRAQVARALYDSAASLEANVEYAQKAVYNNHLVAEAVGLFTLGYLFDGPVGERWLGRGRALLDESVERQFYDDGGYIQHSHNYQRVSLSYLIWACCLQRHREGKISDHWLKAVERSLDFLYAQQNPADGRLSNFGSNDGARPILWDTCDFASFRPVLQLASVLCRGERLYGPGPWDEAVAWMLGPAALRAPLKLRKRVTRSFPTSGQHVLRGSNESTYVTFRCGTLRDRFGQIDMLHVDAWWRGHNVLVDGGIYRYSGATDWYDHFFRTQSHNTVQADGLEQMVHHRRFRTLFPTQARIRAFHESKDVVLACGEHDGFARDIPGGIHRRAILFIKNEAALIVDTLRGSGAHRMRVHWLGGDFPHTVEETRPGMVLHTPEGKYRVEVRSLSGEGLSWNVVRGEEAPIRGWLSRYYGEKVPVPSLEAVCSGALPLGIVTVIGPDPVSFREEKGQWVVETATQRVRLQIIEGDIFHWKVEARP